MSTPTDHPMRVFLSHRAEDSQLAAELKRNLCRIKDISIFVSSDPWSGLGPGVQPIPVIHKNLDESDVYILLYTDHKLQWDWCLYEFGYFRARHTGTPITALHPPGVRPPDPIYEQFQCPAGNSEEMLKLLDILGRGHPSPAHPNDTLQHIADDIEMLLASMARQRGSYECRIRLHTPPESVGHLKQRKIPAASRVEIPPDAADALGFGKTEVTLTKPVDELLQRLLSMHFEVDAFVDACKNIADERPIRPTLPIFVHQRAGAFRPYICSYEIRRNQSLHLEMLLIPIDPAFDIQSNSPFEILFHLLTVEKQLRSQAVEKFAPSFNSFEDDQNAISSDERETLANFARETNAVLAQSSARRLNEPGRVSVAFGNHGAEVDKLYNEWRKSIKAVRALVHPERVLPLTRSEVWTDFDQLRKYNRQLLGVAVRRMKDVVDAMK